MKKRTWSVLLGVAIAMLACTFTISNPTTPTPADEVGTVVATTLQAYTASPVVSDSTGTPAHANGTPVSFESASFVIPEGLAGGAESSKMTALETSSTAPWEVGPTHLRFILTGYALPGKFHEPGLYVYPAADYAGMYPNAAEQIDRLTKLSAGTALMKETLPDVPFFNAEPLIAANIKLLAFQNGNGVRALTEYAQYAAPINNRELFYHYQGLTGDGKYYVIAILPVTAPVLAEDEKPESPVPAEGVPIPENTGPDEIYYFSVTEKLNSLSPADYTPSLDTLDALIQSILIANP